MEKLGKGKAELAAIVGDEVDESGAAVGSGRGLSCGALDEVPFNIVINRRCLDVAAAAECRCVAWRTAGERVQGAR